MTSVLGTVGFVDPEAQASSATSAGRTLSALRASRNFRESAGIPCTLRSTSRRRPELY